MPTPTPTPTHEPVVKVSSPVPGGYVFVPKGNVYITANCRRLTQAAHFPVYAVINHKRQSVGIRVPASIHARVLADERASRADRVSAVEKRDAALEKQFRDAIVRQFPQTPAASVPLVVQRAMLKGSRRVGRTGKLDIETKAKLAVRAHIRHTHTSYDGMLRAKTHTKDQARDAILSKINDVCKSWGGKVDDHRHGRRPQKKKEGKDKRRGNDKDKGKAKAKGEVKGSATTAKQDNSRNKDESAGRRRPNVVNNKPPRQAKKLQARLARRDGNNPGSNPQVGKSLRQQQSCDDSDDEFDDESDEFEWLESDDEDDYVNSDSDWTPGH
ncbi:hypothetical protein PG993_008744 [Apiospora rasikravindrae]|uniref:DUF2293 domain-containing protein n=1 Tax=Apiospora rasikravindrae TaxID=990691 RepID=A0ABR1SP82_9PEZI